MTQAPTNSPVADEPVSGMATLTDIAAYLKVGRRTLQTWLAMGRFPQADLHFGKTRRWHWSTIHRWVDDSRR